MNIQTLLKDKKRVHLYGATLLIAAAMPLVPALGNTYQGAMLAVEHDLIEMQNANNEALQTENLYRMSVITRRTAAKAAAQAKKPAAVVAKSVKR